MDTQKKNRMTMNELAAKLNISRTTLYNIMHGKGSFSLETQERVFKALDKYQFRTNKNARNLAKNRSYPIAFVGFYSTRFEYFFDEICVGIKKAAAEYEDDGLYMIERYSDREDPERQIRDLKELEEAGIENFIIFCYHYEYVYPYIKAMVDRGKNIILFSRRIPNITPLCSVGCNDYLSGKLMMELLEKMAPEYGKVQILVSEHNHQDTLVVGERLQGFQDALKASKKRFTWLERAWTSPLPDKECAEIRNLIETREPDVIVDFVCNLQYTAKYLSESGRKDTLLLGYDVYPEIVPYIKDSVIGAVIYQDLPAQSYKAVQLLFEYACYGKRPGQSQYYLPLNVVLAGNCEYFETL